MFAGSNTHYYSIDFCFDFPSAPLPFAIHPHRQNKTANFLVLRLTVSGVPIFSTLSALRRHGHFAKSLLQTKGVAVTLR